MIVNVRGTHGSGKSTVVTKFLKKYNHVAIRPKGSKKPEAYDCDTPFGKVYVIGSYENECGGCDGIQPYDRIIPLIQKYAELGHVLFEGALISNNYGTICKMSLDYGDDFVFAFLDTPLDVCIERIIKRRTERGNLKPFDPNKSVIRVFERALVARDKIEADGRILVDLKHQDPFPGLLEIFRNAKRKKK